MRRASATTIWFLLVACAGSVAAAPIGSLNSPLILQEMVPEVRDRPSGDQVETFLRYFQGEGREQMAGWLQRGRPYLETIRRQVEEAGLPSTLAYLPMIESGYLNDAVSSKGAAGMWQLMPETAREYGLRVDQLVDERRDATKATEAAIRHLRDLARRFDSPSLVAAAYNAGAGRIARSLEAADADSFEQLLDASILPSETAAFVPRLMAAAKLAADPTRYGLEARAIEPVACDSVVVTRSVRIADVARLANLPVETVRFLNPQYIQGKTPPRSRSVIRLPKGKATTLAGKALASHSARSRAGSKPLATRHVRVRRGDTVESIAERHQVAEGRLRWINALPDWYRLRPGQILVLPDS